MHHEPHGLAQALETFCAQDYPGEIQLVFGVQDPADPAAAIVRDLAERHPGMDIELVVDPRLYGHNRKVSNLINITAAARHDILIQSDADIHVAPDYVSSVVAALAQSGVGAVSCLYIGDGSVGLWSHLNAMAINYQFLPNAILGKTIGMADPCFGSTIALTRETLTRIGGFESVADRLADDYEIGRAVRGLGLAISIPPMLVVHDCTEPSLRALIEHEIRWARTVRIIDPAGYAGSLITNPLPLAVIAGALAGLALARPRADFGHSWGAYRPETSYRRRHGCQRRTVVADSIARCAILRRLPGQLRRRHGGLAGSALSRGTGRRALSHS